MPIYQYKCKKCKEEFELRQSLKDKPIEFCRCGGQLYKVIGNSNFIIRNGGTRNKKYNDGLDT